MAEIAINIDQRDVLTWRSHLQFKRSDDRVIVRDTRAGTEWAIPEDEWAAIDRHLAGTPVYPKQSAAMAAALLRTAADNGMNYGGFTSRQHEELYWLALKLYWLALSIEQGRIFEQVPESVRRSSLTWSVARYDAIRKATRAIADAARVIDKEVG